MAKKSPPTGMYAQPITFNQSHRAAQLINDYNILFPYSLHQIPPHLSTIFSNNLINCHLSSPNTGLINFW